MNHWIEIDMQSRYTIVGLFFQCEIAFAEGWGRSDEHIPFDSQAFAFDRSTVTLNPCSYTCVQLFCSEKCHFVQEKLS